VLKAPTELLQDKLVNRAASLLGLNPDALHKTLRDKQRNIRKPRTVDSSPQAVPATHHVDELELARLLFHHPECLDTVAHYLPLALLTDSDCRHILGALLRGSTQLVVDLADAGDEAQRLAASIMASDTRIVGHENTPESACRDIILRIRRRHLDLRRRTLTERRSQLSGPEHEAVDQELKQIIMDLHTLRLGWDKAQHVLDLAG
jgi:hypothetical protein